MIDRRNYSFYIRDPTMTALKLYATDRIFLSTRLQDVWLLSTERSDHTCITDSTIVSYCRYNIT